ncbi:hypothetical protein [Burkholderia pseudomallei]|nr:hypothetical protein [Burkholderia pseudomallei]MBO3047517.1 hypothetical protein [Burkholderia pseudomallei]
MPDEFRMSLSMDFAGTARDSATRAHRCGPMVRDPFFPRGGARDGTRSI